MPTCAASTSSWRPVNQAALGAKSKSDAGDGLGPTRNLQRCAVAGAPGRGSAKCHAPGDQICRIEIVMWKLAQRRHRDPAPVDRLGA